MPLTSCSVLTPEGNAPDLDPDPPSSRLSPLSDTADAFESFSASASLLTLAEGCEDVMVEVDDDDEDELSVGAASCGAATELATDVATEVDEGVASLVVAVVEERTGGEVVELREEEVLVDTDVAELDADVAVSGIRVKDRFEITVPVAGH